ncbi:DUF2934 domain-containing protein [Pararhizobium arenae]|uniref:DUF2934 domain-containing protein n=1 Tax=Pararhizobium arenae TaxID=1856850 RepID=UPI00094B34A4|nr:DUF2934 domain-containing protein [Pararhizobium arenae]
MMQRKKEPAMGNDWTKWLHERAYALWEGENRPVGRQDEHWLRAEEELKQRQLTEDDGDRDRKAEPQNPASE